MEYFFKIIIEIFGYIKEMLYLCRHNDKQITNNNFKTT